jgi:biopolymer transport protein TolQ
MVLIAAGTVVGGRLASLDPFDLIWQASWVVQLVIVLLVAASIISWAAIIFKWREMTRAEQDSEAFLDVYHQGSPDAAYEAARELNGGPLPAIFLAAYAEMSRMLKYSGRRVGDPLDEGECRTLSRHIAWASSQETLRLESRLPFLATVGSASPFVGLFGTVVGIINAFTGIGVAGSASLAVVAPGIAEALIATAVGLFAAIPATVFYNVFVARLRELTEAVALFSAELEGDVRSPRASTKAPTRATGG